MASVAPDVGAELVARARALIPQLRAEQDAADEAGQYSPSVHEAFGRAGFYRMLRPARFGGLEAGFETFYRVTLEIATGHPAAGWCFALAASHVWVLSSHWPAATQEEILGDGAEFIAPFTNSFTGSCRRVEDGYVVDGTLAYASGAPYATHLIGVVPVQTDAETAGPPDVVALVLPRGDFSMLGDWGGDATIGLRASGSHTVRIDEAFVPAHRAIPFTGFLSAPAVRGEPTPGTQLHGNPDYLGPLIVPFHLNLLAVVVGAARAAIAEFTEVSQVKREAVPPFGLRRDSADAQYVLGQALARTTIAETVLFATAQQFHAACERAVVGGEPFTVAENLRLWALGQQAAELASAAVRALFAASGTSAGRRNARMARYLADAAMYSTHRVASEHRLYPMLGRAQLGVPSGFFGLDD